MAKQKSEPVILMDDLQVALRPTLKGLGFRQRGRGYNRLTDDGLTQVISFQMGTFDPPGTTYIPGLRENLYEKFTVNLGVYIPEVAKYHGGGEARSFVPEHYCAVRSRIGEIGPERADLWWKLVPNSSRSSQIRLRIERDALPFLNRFATRDSILGELLSKADCVFTSVPRIVCAIILARKRRMDEARKLLTEQARENHNPGHPAYVRELADKLGIGALDA